MLIFLSVLGIWDDSRMFVFFHLTVLVPLKYRREFVQKTITIPNTEGEKYQ